MNSSLANLVARRDLLREVTLSDLRGQSAENHLGWLWWLIEPLIMMLIYWAIVAGIFGRGERYSPYPVFVLCGLLPWKYLDSSLKGAVKVLQSREGIIKSIPLPTMVFPLSVVLSGFVYFLAGLAVLLAAALVAGRPVGPALVQLPALFAFQIVAVTGVALAVAAWGAVFADLGILLTYVLRVGFYMTPILYGVDMVAERLGGGAGEGAGWLAWAPEIMMVNPFAILVTGYRDALFYGGFLAPHHWAVLAIEAVLLLLLGFRVYRFYERRVIKFL